MNFLRNLIPHEFDRQKQIRDKVQKEKAERTKQNAKATASRFESSLLELETILANHNGKSNANTAVAP